MNSNSNSDSDSESDEGWLLERSKTLPSAFYLRNPDDCDEYGIYNPTNDPNEIWYHIYDKSRKTLTLFKEFHNFYTQLKIEVALVALEQIGIPVDVINPIILSISAKNDKSYMKDVNEKARLLLEYDLEINRELRKRLQSFGISYDEDDIFVNVVNYAKAKNIDLSNDEIIKKEVAPWLGSTNYELVPRRGDVIPSQQTLLGYSQFIIGPMPKFEVFGDSHITKIVETNKRLNGGAKLSKKKSLYTRKIRKNSKINKKN
jgi:hypothetical protein